MRSFRSRRVAAVAAALLALPFATARAAEPRGVVRAYMDTRIAPCEDFFRYANGAWIDTASIPASFTGIGAGREMGERNREILRQVLEASAANVGRETDPTKKKLGVFYAVLQDSARAEREGTRALKPWLERFARIRTHDDLRREIAWVHTQGVDVPFRFGAFPDAKQSQSTIGALNQGGLGLPDRDDYFRTDPKSDTLRREYVAHVARTFALLGTPAAKARADAEAVFALEKALAESSLTRVEAREPKRVYNPMTVSELERVAPGFGWTSFFAAVGAPTLARPEGRLNVAVPRFARRAAALTNEIPLATWRAYLTFHALRPGMAWLGEPFFEESFRWDSRITGVREPLPRWKRAIDAIDGTMGEALGKAYVERAFPPSSKARMMEMVDDLLSVMSQRIAKLDWMSDSTKTQAERKRAAILRKIGYPDTWRDYTALTVDAKASAFENLRRAYAFEAARQLAKIDKPTDRVEWGMTTPTVNAYYRSSNNEIVFPAGILQPPQFDPEADDALNYGGIGMVIGHEITHGFDDRGRQYDAEGNLKDWWASTDATRFKARADQVVAQYDALVAVDTLHVNGRLTLGENIADLGGVTLAYYAYQRYLERHGRQTIDGFTPEQRFFLGFAQAWRRKLRPESERLRTLTDPHSPARWRVNAPLSNLSEFRAAFGCKDGDPMVRSGERQVVIW